MVLRTFVHEDEHRAWEQQASSISSPEGNTIHEIEAPDTPLTYSVLPLPADRDTVLATLCLISPGKFTLAAPC